MRRAGIDIDENWSEHARRLFGTASIEQIMDTALREAMRDWPQYRTDFLLRTPICSR